MSDDNRRWIRMLAGATYHSNMSTATTATMASTGGLVKLHVSQARILVSDGCARWATASEIARAEGAGVAGEIGIVPADDGSLPGAQRTGKSILETFNLPPMTGATTVQLAVAASELLEVTLDGRPVDPETISLASAVVSFNMLTVDGGPNTGVLRISYAAA